MILKQLPCNDKIVEATTDSLAWEGLTQEQFEDLRKYYAEVELTFFSSYQRTTGLFSLRIRYPEVKS